MTFSMEKIMGFCSGLWQMIGINFCFLCCNIPVLSFFAFVGITEIGNYLPFFLLCLLPLGPSLSALFYSIFRFRREKDIKIFSVYKKGYCNNFKQSIELSLLQLSIIFMMAMNIRFFTSIISIFFMQIFFKILFIGVVILTPYFYLLIMRYKLSVKDIIKNTLILALGRPLLLLGNTAAFLFVLVFYEIMPGTAILFLGSVYGYLIIYMNQKIFSDMENEQELSCQ